MPDYKAKISRDDYLRALALFTMALERHVEAVSFAESLNKIIMTVPEKYPGGHVDDLIYSGHAATVADFNDALHKDGVEVAPEEKAESDAPTV